MGVLAHSKNVGEKSLVTDVGCKFGTVYWLCHGGGGVFTFLNFTEYVFWGDGGKIVL